MGQWFSVRMFMAIEVPGMAVPRVAPRSVVGRLLRRPPAVFGIIVIAVVVVLAVLVAGTAW